MNNNGNTFYTGGGTGLAYATTNVRQSSTGNPTGIYDLNGNAWEYVAGYIANGNVGNFFVNSTVNTPYATAYPYNVSSDNSTNNWAVYKNKQTSTYGYGDAILETSTSGSGSTSWSTDYSNFPATIFPFFLRSGSYEYGVNVGVFAFSNYSGSEYFNIGFRGVLVP